MARKRSGKDVLEFDSFCELLYNKWSNSNGSEKQLENLKKRVLADWNDKDKMALWKMLAASNRWDFLDR